jgi:predicted unusual protein kinase regulating ubiquinone biosynthesis (AarF/ABC1/UbiB family)
MRAALEELGPTFSKLGQILSTRPDLLPPEFIDELAQLQDHVPPLSEDQVVTVMEQELGVPWEDVFEHVDPEPLAAGTIAEVHRAVLANGELAVIKVQRPDARELIEQDLALLEVFAEKAGDRPGLRAVIDLKAVFTHLSESLHRELDFRNEARNVERMREVIAPFDRLAVPAIYTEFSTGRLLVMGDVGGGPITVAPEGPIRTIAARQLLESFYKQVMVDGFFHADPHPGNLMWRPEEDKLYFLDLGMTGEVGPDLREQMMLLLMAFWQNDVGFLTDVTLMMAGAIDRSDLDVEAFQGEIGQLMAKYQGASIQDIQLGPVLQEMTEISLRYGVPLPASLTLTAKALAQMQLAAAQLDPTVDPFDVAGKFMMRSLLTGMGGKVDPKALFYQVQRMKVRAMRVIEAVERLIGARPGQKLEVNFRAASLERTVRRAGRRLAIGLVAAAALLGAAITATSTRVERWVPLTLGAIGLLFVIGLLMDLYRDRRDRIL